jgi:uncharacterized membrane protein
MSQLMYGLITGFLFGFLLQKGRVLRFEKQINALLFKDLTIIKFMLSSVAVAMAGTYLLVDLELAKLSIKATVLGANIIGGLLFGLGWAVLGYCPGTSIGAVAEGPLGCALGCTRHAGRSRSLRRGFSCHENYHTYLGEYGQSHPAATAGD